MNEIDKYKERELPSNAGTNSSKGFVPNEAVVKSDEARHPDKPTPKTQDKFGEDKMSDTPVDSPSQESKGG